MHALLSSALHAVAGGGADTLSDAEIDIVSNASTVVSVASMLGSLSIVATYARFPHLRRFAMRLVLMLSLSDIGNQIADFVGPSASDMEAMAVAGAPVTGQCYAQAILDSFFELASVTWTSAIAVMLYLSVFHRMSAEEVSARFPLFCAACFGLPALLALLPLADGSYGPTGAWCWVTRDYWRVIQFYGPLWLCIAFNTYVYVRVLRLLRRTLRASGPNDATAASIRKFTARLQWYPFILVIVWLWATVNRIVETATGGQQIFWLFLLQRVFSSSQGLCNAVAYGLTSEGVKDALQDDLASTFPGWCGRLGAERRAAAGGSVLGSGGAEAGASGGKGGASAPGEEDTLAAAHGGGGSGSGGRDSRTHLGTSSGTVDARPLPPPPVAGWGGGAVVQRANPLEQAAGGAGGGSGGVGLSDRGDRVRAALGGSA